MPRRRFLPHCYVTKGDISDMSVGSVFQKTRQSDVSDVSDVTFAHRFADYFQPPAFLRRSVAVRQQNALGRLSCQSGPAGVTWQVNAAAGSARSGRRSSILNAVRLW